MKGQGFWLIDPALTDSVGHPAHYDRVVGQEARARGYDFRVLAPAAVPPALAGELGAVPALERDWNHRFLGTRRGNLVLEPLLCSREFRRDLGRALPELDRSSVLFMPTVDHRYLPAWARFLVSRAGRRGPRVVLLFRFSYFEAHGVPQRPVKAARICFRLLEAAARGRDVHVTTDSELLAEEYRQLTRLPVAVLPIPHIPSADRVDRRAPSGPLRVVLPGDARPDKGFALAATAISLLHQRGQLAGLQFVLQIHARESHRVMRDRALATLPRFAVELIDGVLAPAEYHGLIQGADLVLLPYSAAAYHSRTSGPFAEALAAGRPVIVTEGTWMSHELARSGAGVTFRDGDAEDLARAIVAARDRRQELAQRAVGEAARWTSFHNPRTFMDLLLGAAGPPAD